MTSHLLPAARGDVERDERYLLISRTEATLFNSAPPVPEHCSLSSGFFAAGRPRGGRRFKSAMNDTIMDSYSQND